MAQFSKTSVLTKQIGMVTEAQSLLVVWVASYSNSVSLSIGALVSLLNTLLNPWSLNVAQRRSTTWCFLEVQTPLINFKF